MKKFTKSASLIFYLLLVLLLLAGSLVSCSSDGSSDNEPTAFTAALWNVQNLFDAQDNGNEYSEFRESADWNEEKYKARLTAISQAISGITRGEPSSNGNSSKQTFPDLIGFVEIENLGVLEDLSSGGLSKQGYNWAAFANIPGSPIGLGLMSRYPITDIRAHSITIENDTAPRPVLEIRIEPKGEPLIFLLCHWKSKVGGDEATTAMRRASARVIQWRIQEIWETEPDTPIIVMGDLNENHDEYYRRLAFSALLTDDPDAAALTTSASSAPANQRFDASSAIPDYLVLSQDMPPRSRYFPDGIPAFYSPWFDDTSETGTYYFRDNWETIDHFLLSESLFTDSGWNYSGFKVVSQAPFTTSAGIPNRYNPQSGRGLSDHLPLLLFLELKIFSKNP